MASAWTRPLGEGGKAVLGCREKAPREGLLEAIGGEGEKMGPGGRPGRHGQSLGPCSDDVGTEPLSGAFACLGVTGRTSKENGEMFLYSF